MSLIRFVARSLFASAFIADGVGKLTKPSASAAQAEDFTKRVAPMVQGVVPSSVSSSVPEEAETWVRLGGGAQVLGGAMFATGIMRRVGAVLLSLSSVLNLAIALPGSKASAEERKEKRPDVLQKVALLGAAVLATQDLQGKPSLSWRASHALGKTQNAVSDAGENLSRKAKKASKKADKRARKLAKKAEKQTKKFGKKLESVVS